MRKMGHQSVLHSALENIVGCAEKSKGHTQLSPLADLKGEGVSDARSFRELLAKSYVHAPASGKSWIRHCSRIDKYLLSYKAKSAHTFLQRAFWNELIVFLFLFWF